MCTKEEFARMRDMMAGNTKAIGELQKADAVQSEQIKTLFHTTERQGENMTKQNTMLIIAIISVLVLAVLALIFGALGKDGFNGVTKAAPGIIKASN